MTTAECQAGDRVRFRLDGTDVVFEGDVLGFEPPAGPAYIERYTRGGDVKILWVHLHELLGVVPSDGSE